MKPETVRLMLVIMTAILIGGVAGKTKAEIHRSSAAIAHFKKERPCPATDKHTGPCQGYVIDHIVPLACNGKDDPINMQWQSVKEGKAKDRWERKDCSIWKELKDQINGESK